MPRWDETWSGKSSMRNTINSQMQRKSSLQWQDKSLWMSVWIAEFRWVKLCRMLYSQLLEFQDQQMWGLLKGDLLLFGQWNMPTLSRVKEFHFQSIKLSWWMYFVQTLLQQLVVHCLSISLQPWHWKMLILPQWTLVRSWSKSLYPTAKTLEKTDQLWQGICLEHVKRTMHQRNLMFMSFELCVQCQQIKVWMPK